MKLNNQTLDGVRPGKGFKDALLAPLEMKEYISNESRLEHGKRVLATPARFKPRSLSLEFNVTAKTTASLDERLTALFDILYTADVKLEVPEFTDKVFHLRYTGKSPSYDRGVLGCKVKVGFDEPNPNNRTS